MGLTPVVEGGEEGEDIGKKYLWKSLPCFFFLDIWESNIDKLTE